MNFFVPPDLRMDGSESDTERLALFRQTLKLFVGSHPFHNYTSMKQHDGARTKTRDFNNVRKRGPKEDKIPRDFLSGTAHESA